MKPVELKDFRPISSVGCATAYTLLSKILANGLKDPHIINPCQGAFVHHRQILDGILIANELINFRKQSHKGGNFKIDLGKAYAHMEWNFIDYMSGRFGFLRKEDGRKDAFPLLLSLSWRMVLLLIV